MFTKELLESKKLVKIHCNSFYAESILSSRILTSLFKRKSVKYELKFEKSENISLEEEKENENSDINVLIDLKLEKNVETSSKNVILGKKENFSFNCKCFYIPREKNVLSSKISDLKLSIFELYCFLKDNDLLDEDTLWSFIVFFSYTRMKKFFIRCDYCENILQELIYESKRIRNILYKDSINLDFISINNTINLKDAILNNLQVIIENKFLKNFRRKNKKIGEVLDQKLFTLMAKKGIPNFILFESFMNIELNTKDKLKEVFGESKIFYNTKLEISAKEEYLKISKNIEKENFHTKSSNIVELLGSFKLYKKLCQTFLENLRKIRKLGAFKILAITEKFNFDFLRLLHQIFEEYYFYLNTEKEYIECFVLISEIEDRKFVVMDKCSYKIVDKKGLRSIFKSMRDL